MSKAFKKVVQSCSKTLGKEDAFAERIHQRL